MATLLIAMQRSSYQTSRRAESVCLTGGTRTVHTNTHRQTDCYTQAHRQTDCYTQAHRQTVIQSHTSTQTDCYTEPHKHTDRLLYTATQAHRQTVIHSHTSTQTDCYTEKQAHMQAYIVQHSNSAKVFQFESYSNSKKNSTKST